MPLAGLPETCCTNTTPFAVPLSNHTVALIVYTFQKKLNFTQNLTD